MITLPTWKRFLHYSPSPVTNRGESTGHNLTVSMVIFIMSLLIENSSDKPTVGVHWIKTKSYPLTLARGKAILDCDVLQGKTFEPGWFGFHYSDIIMSAMASPEVKKSIDGTGASEVAISDMTSKDTSTTTKQKIKTGHNYCVLHVLSH